MENKTHYDFNNIVLNLDQAFEEFLVRLDKEIGFYSLASDEQDLLRVEFHEMFSQAIMNATAFALDKKDLIDAQNEIVFSPYTNPLDVYLGFAANNPRIDEILTIELDSLLETILELYRKI